MANRSSSSRSSAARRRTGFGPLWPILLLAAAPAWAGDAPRYEPAPNWASRATPLPTVADGQGIVLFDRAYRIEGDTLWSFTDLALKITSPEMLSQVGTVSVQWQPDHGDAVIHRLEIVRDGQVIDALGDRRFEILRREQGLEQLSLNGQLTATHQVQGLRLGDTLRFTSSTVARDPVLDGNVQLIGPLIAQPVALGGGKVRLSWPADKRVTWKLAGVAQTPQPTREGGFQTLVIDQPVAKLPEAPDALPMRLMPVALFEATTFRDWAEVSALGARLFAPGGLIAEGSDLAQRTDAIAAASTDPAGAPGYYREAQAIRLPVSGQGFTVEGRTAIDAMLGGYATTRELRREGDRVEFVETQRTAAWEVPAATLPAEREQLARATSASLKLVAPADYPSQWEEARTARVTGTLQPLIAAYDRLVAGDPKEAEWYVNRARFYEGVLDSPRAVADVTKAIEFRPDAATYNWRGWLQHDSAPKKAAADYEAALALDPAHGNALWNLFDLALVRRDYPGAQAVVERAERSGLETAGVTRMRAELAAEQGRPEEGLALLSGFYARKPATPDGLNDLCWFKGRFRVDLPSALKDCTRAIELGSQPARYLDSRALVYLQMDRPEEALADLDAVLAVAPDQVASTLLRGIALQRLGRAGAASDLAVAAEVSPILTKRYARYGMTP